MSGLKKKLQKAQNKAKKIVSEIKKVEKFANAPMRTTGRAVGNKLGNRKAGEAIGGILGRVFGTGDYVVRSNSLAVHGGPTDAAPSFSRNGRGTRVCHREFLGVVTASAIAGEFKNTSYSLNPGNAQAFPWLASIAANFDQWQPNGIVVTYKNMSSTYSGTASLGTVILASDYDVFDAPFSSKIEMENSQFCVSANCATDLIHPVECNLNERFTRVLNVRDGTIPTGDSKRFYDLCNLQVATQGATANQLCGELWISYDITFYKEQLPAPLVDRAPCMYLVSTGSFNSVSNMLGSGNFRLRTFLDNGDQYDGSYSYFMSNLYLNNPNALYVSSTSTTSMALNFPRNLAGSNWLIRIQVIATSGAATAPTVTYTNMAQLTDSIEDDGDYVQTGTISQQLLEYCAYTGTSTTLTNMVLSSWNRPPGTISQIRIQIIPISVNAVGTPVIM